MPSFKDRRPTFLSLLPLLPFVFLAVYFSGNYVSSPVKVSQLHSRFGDLPPDSGLVSRTVAAGSDPVSLVPWGLARRQEDDPYTCGPGRPCSNGACCGVSGNCGYAPAYCGDGCQSNCDAKAECGQYAVSPGQTCKLNACCSEHGFCGTTEEFCTDGCQSNCILEPRPPAGSPKGAALDRVIGYYESWSYRSPCNQKFPSDLPLRELTHLNYAFAFIDPQSYELVTMDMEQEDELWQITVDAKRYNPDLRIYVAVGGWTFSDNDTVTQPLFGDIARTEANRQKFADGVVRLLNKYGFDGLDIDWEYPGAGDRGGHDEDTPNFVLLMKTLRATFDASPRRLGLTFTIPSSFWYLRWFDMPGLLQYADWTNLMSYDLHGTWDEHNPIGAIAQAHTNLTEIKLATQLLWRVGIKPEQVVLGYGFYGRAFELADPSCNKPGCPFAGGAKKGPCSNEAGILMYYEIQAILKQYPDLEPVFDEEAAVKYLTWDRDQWISYDDADTFALKLEWANEVGFGGSMIWAVDTDDDKFSAMSGLMGYPVSHIDTSKTEALAMTDSNVVETLKLENGEGCQIMKDYDCMQLGEMTCPNGQDLVAYDRNGCGSEDDTEGVPVCCPTGSTSKRCTWRGTPEDGGIWGDCNGQCHAGETKIGGSSYGGGPSADEDWPLKRCARGGKVLCCGANDWKQVIDGCYWTPCFGGTRECTGDTIQLATKKGSCPMGAEQKYCCPSDTGLYECKWRGSAPDCVGANCKTHEDGKELFEVQVDAHAGGSSWNLCSYDRKKALCCQVRVAIPEPLTCVIDSCDIDYSLCSQSNKDEWGNDLEPRGAGTDEQGFAIFSSGLEVDLEKRSGDKRTYKWVTSFGMVVAQASMTYFGPPGYMARLRTNLIELARVWVTRSENCGTPGVQAQRIDPAQGAPSRAQVEHTLGMFVIGRFASSAEHGRMWSPRPAGYMDRRGREIGQTHPEGRLTNTPAVGTHNFWRDVWNSANSLPAGLPLVSLDSPEQRRIPDRLYEALGSNNNPSHFTLLQDNINGMKGRVEIFNAPMAPRRFETFLTDATDSSNDAPIVDVMSFMAPLRELVGMFQYLRAYDVITRTDATATAVHFQLQLVELHVADAQGLSAYWNEFYPEYFRLVSQFARTWAQARIAEIRAQYNANPNAMYREDVKKALKEIEDDIPNWKYPFED